VKCFVTGASGFVGSNLVHELVSLGHDVTVRLRRGSNARTIEGLPVRHEFGELCDRPSLVKALRGCDWCFHVAASYHLWMADYAPMFEANVSGTRTVLGAAAEAGCRRIVYTSTVGCVGLPAPGRERLEPSHEGMLAAESQMVNHYKLSKWRAEQEALKLAASGAPVIIVNPSAPVGPRDAKPSPTGQVVVDFLNRALPGYVDTGLNWVHVRDVAIGHILAAERGRVGERYILGHADGNWTMQQTLTVLAEITGLRAPRLRVPYAVALGAAWVNEAIASWTGRAPKAPLAGVRMARYKMWFNPAKAIRELGLPQTPPRRAFEDAVAWYRTHGYAGSRPA
jgi:dihydroflavonol-4-reductase